ncbi:MAG: DUF1343 domain-containing protein [Luteitalea sp.]|nr:DUF1343 domain-containing protein [Luteitalea sp.]
MVTLGIERLLASDRLKGLKVGLVANPSSVDASLQHVADRLRAMPHVTLAALFGPQHGFHSTVQDDMLETPDAVDPQHGIPIYSLYSDTREPTPAMLDGLDALVIDLQDIGTRVYTYIYTMANCLKAAARCGLPVIVCDRPNPIGGEAVEGPVLQPGFESFVGLFPIPLRHGLTIGELATLFNEAFDLGARLDVIELDGWRRAMCFDQTGLAWVMPSPNMPTLDTALVYPGAVLFEGTMVSEGRGTTRPFEIIGAPWIDAEAFAASLNTLALPGVHMRPVWFQPTFQKHANLTCGGCQIHVTNRGTFQPVRTAVALLGACRRAAPDRFAWREPPYEYEHEKLPIDVLAGSDAFRRYIDADATIDAIVNNWQPGLASFMKLRRDYLRYR